VSGLTKIDDERSAALEAALMATRRDELEHGTTAACAGLRLQGMPGASAAEDGEESNAVFAELAQSLMSLLDRTTNREGA
jgi:hypothetical protein